jgi:hypothetical protein
MPLMPVRVALVLKRVKLPVNITDEIVASPGVWIGQVKEVFRCCRKGQDEDRECRRPSGG